MEDKKDSGSGVEREPSSEVEMEDGIEGDILSKSGSEGWIREGDLRRGFSLPPDPPGG